jgi:hypothetical protein
MTPPDWLNHPHTRCGSGWADFGDVRRQVEDDFDALLKGGNCVLRANCFDKGWSVFDIAWQDGETAARG